MVKRSVGVREVELGSETGDVEEGFGVVETGAVGGAE